MPVSRKLLAPHNIVVLIYHGEVTSDEMILNMVSLLKEPRFFTSTRILLIYAENADLSALKNNDVHRLKTYSPLLENKANHVIVASDDHAFGLARMFASQTAQGDITVLRTVEEAASALQLSLSALLDSHQKDLLTACALDPSRQRLKTTPQPHSAESRQFI